MTTFSQIISESHPIREKAYIDYFFREIASIHDQEPNYKKMNFIPNSYFSIVKDSTERILENKTGKLMERSWRNILFYFVDKQIFIKYFGQNQLFPVFNINGDQIIYSGKKTRQNAQKPHEPRVRREIIDGLQNYVFKTMKSSKSSWFVRSYVYIVLILCDKNSNISNADFYIHYWNTNYLFRRITNKKNIFHNVKNSYFVEDLDNELSLIEMTNRDAIDCVKAYAGTLDFRNQTDENYQDIKKDIDDGIKYILIKGTARTGKTILAMRVLGTYPQSKLLLMNYNFYRSLEDSFNIQNIKFPQNRIFHHDLSKKHGCWISDKKTKHIIPKLDFLIVDEAQRLAVLGPYGVNGKVYAELDELREILFNENQKTTILLGDDFQKINPEFDKGLKKIYDLVKDKNFREYYFKQSIGISPSHLENVKYLLNIDDVITPSPTFEFEIDVTNNAEVFYAKFFTDTTKKKHIVSIGLKQLKKSHICLRDKILYFYPKELKDQDFPYFFNEEIIHKYILTTYEVISREIESVYLFIPKKVTYNKSKKTIELTIPCTEKENEFLVNHIYTLMTRATLKLNILCEDDELYKYLDDKINNIKKTNHILYVQGSESNENEEPELATEEICYDYDVFLAYHGTNNPNGSYNKAKELCDNLKNSGYKVFLYGYSCLEDHNDLGFNETKYIIQRCQKMIFVFNDSVPKDNHGMIPRKYEDGSTNQLYSELRTFDSMVEDGERNFKRDFRFMYDGSVLHRGNIYNFLNKFYRPATMGNSNCCFFTIDETLSFLANCFKENES